MYSISDFKKLIKILLSKKLKPTTNWKNYLTTNTLLLRHDIDFDIDYAHKLATVEKTLGVRSTYFFMLSSNMYNLFSIRNQLLIKDIIKMGHKISVHYDPTSNKIINSFSKERKAFEELFNINLDIVSIHRPGKFLKNNNRKLNGLSHTYQDKYFKDMNYLSDSGGKDIFPLILNYLKNPRRKGLHLLIHPIWWIKRGKSSTEILNRWKEKNSLFVKSEIRANCKAYLD